MLAAIGALACVLVARAGVAQTAPPADRTLAAQALFDEARRLIARGEVASGCAKLEESQRLDAAWGTLINLADCYERLGRTASAWRTFGEVAAGAGAAGQAERARVAGERAARLEPRLPRLALVVAPSAGAAGERREIRIDGVPIARERWSAPVPVDPGPHTVEATAPGKRTWRGTVAAATTAEHGPIAVEIPALVQNGDGDGGAGVAVATESGGARPAEGPRRAWMRITALTLAVAGVAAAGFGAYEISRARDLRDQRDQLCPPPRGPSGEIICGSDDRGTRGLAAHQAGQRAQTRATVGFAIGGALVAAAAVTFALAPRGGGQDAGAAGPAPAASLSLAPTATGGWTLLWQGRF